MKTYLQRMIDILSEFLGKPKSDYIDVNSSLSFEFNCPRCAEENGYVVDGKYNLGINLVKGGGLFNCWKCSTHSNDMKGKIYKLFKMYGNENLWEEYKYCLKQIRETELYKLNFSSNDFKIEDEIEQEDLKLPDTYTKFNDKLKNTLAYCYLKGRGIDDLIIEKYNIGYTKWDNGYPILSNRIVIPSYNEFGILNYWVSRDFSGKSRMKYLNPKVEKKNIIFNEGNINWDNDITLCEGAFDAIVIPNSIPLLGKSLEKDYKLHQMLFKKANGNINILLDGDEVGTKAAFEVYKNLNYGRLYNKIRYIHLPNDLDPSKVFELYGRKGIMYYLSQSIKINPIYLIK